MFLFHKIFGPADQIEFECQVLEVCAVKQKFKEFFMQNTSIEEFKNWPSGLGSTGPSKLEDILPWSYPRNKTTVFS